MYCRPEHPLLLQNIPPSPTQIPAYPWSAVALDKSLSPRLRSILGMKPNQALPIALTCDNLQLLHDLTLHSDNILLTWKSWVDSKNELVNLVPLLEPQIPETTMNIECAIVQLADRSLSPPAQRLVDLILLHADLS